MATYLVFFTAFTDAGILSNDLTLEHDVFPRKQEIIDQIKKELTDEGQTVDGLYISGICEITEEQEEQYYSE